MERIRTPPERTRTPPEHNGDTGPGDTADWIAGVILGGALGDAVGLPAEGSDAYSLSEKYPKGIDYPYKGRFRGYPPGDWTDATDTTVLVMRSLVLPLGNSAPAALQSAFAARAVDWHKKGFPELGDTGGVQPEAVLAAALADPNFAGSPAVTALGVKGFKLGNGALIRTAPCAFHEAPAVIASVLCVATHADERCVAASVALAWLLHGTGEHISHEDPVALLVTAVGTGLHHMSDPANRAEYLTCVTNSRDISKLDLSDKDRKSHVFKALAVAVWAWRQVVKTPPMKRNEAFFKETIKTVAAEGGDASANCAVAGTVLGAALGGRRLPAGWLTAMPNIAWLEKEIETFVALVLK